MWKLINFLINIISNKKNDLSNLIKALFAILAPFGFIFIFHIDEFSNINTSALLFSIIIYAIIFLFLYNHYLEMRIKISTNIIQKQATKFIESNDKLTIIRTEMEVVITNYNESLIKEKNVLRKNFYKLCINMYGRQLMKLEKFKTGIENLDKQINNADLNQNIIDLFSFRNSSSIDHFNLLLMATISSFLVISYIQGYITTISETFFSLVIIFIILLLPQTLKHKLKYWHLILLMSIYEIFLPLSIVNLKRQNFKFNEKTKL